MGFYWKDKKDQLFARRGAMPSTSEPDPWTSFAMPLREPAPVPTLFDFVRFLTSSITFVAHLSRVSVWFDGRELAKIQRERGPPRPLGLLENLRAQSSKGMMKVSGIQSAPLHIRAEVMRCIYVSGSSKPKQSRPLKPQPRSPTTGTSGGFFSSLFSSFTGTPSRTPTPAPLPTPSLTPEAIQAKDAEERKKLLQMNETSVVLTIFGADISVSVDERMRRELLRATKKNPPSKTRLELIYVSAAQTTTHLRLE